jgi:hypothetical protein
MGASRRIAWSGVRLRCANGDVACDVKTPAGRYWEKTRDEFDQVAKGRTTLRFENRRR